MGKTHRKLQGIVAVSVLGMGNRSSEQEEIHAVWNNLVFSGQDQMFSILDAS